MVGFDSVSGELEKCPRCGTAIYGFSKKYSQSVGEYYCVKCAEALDRDYLARTTCAMCGKALTKSDVKFVMSSRFFNSSGMSIVDRLMCADCHSRVATRSREANSFSRNRLNAIRNAVRKSLAKGTMIIKT
jgi:uncharacterized protein YlaI